MTDNEHVFPSTESESTDRLRFEEGWTEILEAPDAIDYQTWLADICDLTSQELGNPEMDRLTILRAWQAAIEQVADIAIDPEEINDMTHAQIVETALVTLKINVDSMGWDEDGLVFTVPNMFSGEEATIDIRDLL